MTIAGRVALVTGATSGVGRGVALAFMQRGVRVVGTGRREEAGRRLAEEARTLGGEFLFVSGDVGRVSDCERWISSAVSAFGRLDILVNNAGTMGRPAIADSHTATEEWWDEIVDTNLKGAFFCSRYALEVMRPRQAGVILNMSSTAAIESPARMAAYAASKAGLVQLTRTLAVEYVSDGIRINAVLLGGAYGGTADESADAIARYMRGPDYVRPPRTSAEEIFMQQPEEIGAVLALLCEDDARLITGATIALDRTLSAGLTASTVAYMTCSQLWTFPEAPPSATPG